MKVIFSAAIFLGLCNSLVAKEEKADPVGTWKCEFEAGGQMMKSTLVVKKDGDKLVGTMTYEGIKEAKLTEVKLKDGELTFVADVEYMNLKITVKYKLKVEGDKLKGTAVADVGGDTHEIDIDGTRKKDK